MSSHRRVIFRIIAVGLGLSVFVVLEGVCRLAGWGDDQRPTAAFAEVAAVRPLFERDETGRLMTTAENRRGFFAADSFSVPKPRGVSRIFVFGGSTVQGRPFSVATSFTTFLKLALQTIEADRTWEVVNCGGVSYASYRLLPIMRECLRYEPDLYIVCTGHNEFLECVTYAQARQAAEITKRSYNLLHNFNSFHVLTNLMRVPPASPPVPKLPLEVDALLDHRNGLEAYCRANLHAQTVVEGFRHNLLQMAKLAKAARVPLLFVLPPSNLQDCPPFKSEFSANTSQADQQWILDALREARQQDPSSALEILTAATARDSSFAFSWYQLGRAFLAQQDSMQAAAAFMRARDEDVCPLRMTSDLEAQMRHVAEVTETPLADAAAILAANNNSISGDAVLVDHVHPSFRSHQKIALALLSSIANAGFAAVPSPEQIAAAEQTFAAHLQSLDNLYYLRGRRTLRAVREWTQGRADGPALQTRQGLGPIRATAR